MKVSELMTHPLREVAPTDTIAGAAALMTDHDVGALPVVKDGKLVGILTDRDIVVRAVAGRTPGRTRIAGIMSGKVAVCAPDDEIDDVLETMAAQQLRRLPVCAGDGRLVGMFSIGDAARTEEYQEAAARTLSAICRPHGRHSQKRDRNAGRPPAAALSPAWYDPALD